MSIVNRNCDNCGKTYKADSRNLKRGWGLCCSKSCAAQKREKNKPGYNPKHVAINNQKRLNYQIKAENGYGPYTGKHTSEGYKMFGNTAIDEYGDPVYTIDGDAGDYDPGDSEYYDNMD